MLKAVIILAAGQGTRMRSSLPKILHPLGGKAMVHHVIDAVAPLAPEKTIVILSSAIDPEVVAHERQLEIAIQDQALGTGDAVAKALPLLQGQDGDVLILCGDTPLIEAETLQLLINARQQTGPEDILMLAMTLADPHHYGRLVVDGGVVNKIVENKDASPEEKEIRLCNAGIYMVPLAYLHRLLPKLTKANAAGEYYITDIIALAAEAGIKTRYVEGLAHQTLQGINNRVELACAERELQQRWRAQMLLAGVTMVDPETVYLCHDTKVGQDTVIHPHVCFGPNVTIGAHAIVFPYCQLSDCEIGDFAKVGPFAHLRGHAVLQRYAEVGNFVEVKNSLFAEKAKAKHLSYIGDAHVGEGANIGAGTITCNYNGFEKFKTTIAAGAFIGSNSALVAPVVIGEGAIVAAGSVITRDVPKDALAVSRTSQENKIDWAKAFRKKKLN